VRIPHHAEPRVWFDGIVIVQIAWMALGVLLSRGNKLMTIMIVTMAITLVLMLAQVLSGNESLALLFPWRTSSFLVPLATTVIVGRLVAFSGAVQHRAVQAACWTALIALAAGGIAILVFGWGYQTSEDELPMLNYVRDHRQSGDVYLIPVRIPTPRPRQGVISTNFTPAPRGKDRHLVAIDLQRFRLYTGIPLYVDFKSIPYKDVEVLEWQRRLELCEAWYAAGDVNRADLLTTLRREGITHVVASAAHGIVSPELEQVYRDESYIVYRVLPAHQRLEK
jgi:hypothetical protein